MLVKAAVLCALAGSASAFVTPGHVAGPRFAPKVRRATVPPSMMFGGGAGKSFLRSVRSVRSRMPKVPGKNWGGAGMCGGGDGGATNDATPAPEPEGDDENPLASLWKGYETFLDEQPLLAKALTSLVGFCIGDILAQKFIQKTDPFDWFRLFRLASFGFLIHGTTSHYFYGFLDRKIPGTDAKTVFTKVFIDQVMWNPIFGVMFFGYVAMLEAKGFAYVVDKVQNELLTQVFGSWKVWPLAHTINFRFIPSSQRVLYINTIQIGYNCFLSLISNREKEA